MLSDELPPRLEHLLRALEDEGAPSYMLERVRNGTYDHFSSKRTNRYGENLISHAKKEGLPNIARRAQAGEFDAA